MVEMMLMQNAQMHQIIMQNMMLKALPPMAFSHPSGTGAPLLQHIPQVIPHVEGSLLKQTLGRSGELISTCQCRACGEGSAIDGREAL